MKGFDLYLQQSLRTDPDWTEHYIDYGSLKSTLKSYYRRRRSLQQLFQKNTCIKEEEFESILTGEEGINSLSKNSNENYFQYDDTTHQQELVPQKLAYLRLSLQERNDFSLLLEKNLKKAASFYSGTLLVNLLDIVSSAKYEDIEAGREILEVMAFVVANVISFRQLLIRYDAFCRTFDGVPLSEWQLHRQMHESSFTMMFQIDALDSFQEQIFPKLSSSQQQTLRDQSAMFHDLLDKSSYSINKAVGGHMVFRDRSISAIRQYFFFGLQARGLMLEPKVLMMRGKNLKKEIKLVAKWKDTGSESTEEGFGGKLKDLPAENVFPLVLNLVSCFLFMMNNYIIEPSSAYYANALGSSDAMSGLMIGAAPWFALVSAIGYSIWTNYSYKQPMMFAMSLMIVGNWIYANAYTYKSMELCLIGRALQGLGAPRIINRRYVADATPFSLRTASSAAFAMATALGAALGPGMAILIDMVGFEFDLPILGKQYFNGMTGPGYFMSLCWALNGILILLTFQEPNRSGLDELRKREIEKQSEKTDTLLDPEQDETYFVDESDWEDGFEPKQYEKEDTEVSSNSPFHCVKNMTQAVALCMVLILMKRVALESIVGATSIITKNRYGWNIKNVGALHLLNGLIVIPVSAFAGYLSQFYEDRYMALWFLSITLVGMLLLVDITDLISHDNEGYNADNFLAVGSHRYIAGSLIAFSGIEACESYVASLMSKVVPSALAVGTFNSGLLATLVGTGGRALGDLFITLMGLISVRNLLNMLVLPGAFLMSFSIFLIRYNYEIIGV